MCTVRFLIEKSTQRYCVHLFVIVRVRRELLVNHSLLLKLQLSILLHTKIRQLMCLF